MEFTLLSPKKIIRPKGGPFQASFEITRQDTFTLVEGNLAIIKPVDTFYKSIPNGQYQALIPNILPLTKVIAETYLKFQSVISHCITNSEAVNNQLRNFLLDINELNINKEEILKMDFMTLRNTFSEFFHAYKSIQNESNFNTKAQRKALTKFMHQFITDRNIYTHGTLRIQRPEEIFVIDYIENSKAKVRAEVTNEILESFLNIANLIRSLLNQISSFYYKQKNSNATNK